MLALTAMEVTLNGYLIAEQTPAARDVQRLATNWTRVLTIAAFALLGVFIRWGA